MSGHSGARPVPNQMSAAVDTSAARANDRVFMTTSGARRSPGRDMWFADSCALLAARRGQSLEPGMIRFDARERIVEKRAAALVEVRGDVAEIGVVLGARTLRLVEELDLGSEVGNPRAIETDRGRERTTNIP